MTSSLETLGTALTSQQLGEATGATITGATAAQLLKLVQGGGLPR
jgi:hypothetical protein